MFEKSDREFLVSSSECSFRIDRTRPYPRFGVWLDGITLREESGGIPRDYGRTHPPNGMDNTTLPKCQLVASSFIREATIEGQESTIRKRLGENNPFGLKTCDICQGEFPCWQQACPITERFICDDCADDELDQTDSPATRWPVARQSSRCRSQLSRCRRAVSPRPLPISLCR